MASTKRPNRYTQIIETIFARKYREGMTSIPFDRAELITTATELGIDIPKNIGDVIYSFRARTAFPESIQEKAPAGQSWVIVSRGRSQYAFELRALARIRPDEMLPIVKIPDATPGIVARYALSDEQALLSRIRYNRLLDIFTGVTCYSLQNHLRTTVRDIGQVETDEIYVGVDKRGAHYVFPVQAKGGTDELSVIQIEQDLALCLEKFPALEARSIAAQFMADDVIALFEFSIDEEKDIVKLAERHYRLVPVEELSDAELNAYRHRLEN
jgi:hypothetical protein